MPVKPKVAFCWLASCGGCEEAVLDLDEAVLNVVSAVDIVQWPVALDFKKADLEAMPDGAITVAFVNGAVRTTEQEELARLVRAKAQVVIAFGACAQLGGIPGLANLWNRETIFREVYRETPSTVNPAGVLPQRMHQENGRTVTLPGFYNTVRTLAQVIDVDYSIPGCPPTPQLLAQAVEALLAGKLPPKGTVLAPDIGLCDECPRRRTRPEKLTIEAFHRPHQIQIDPELCLLAQGLLCMGSATRSGCGARCIQGNMPCTGCFGPTSRVRHFGPKAISAIAALGAAEQEERVESLIDGIPDPVGSFYRYSLASSVLRRRRMDAVEKA